MPYACDDCGAEVPHVDDPYGLITIVLCKSCSGNGHAITGGYPQPFEDDGPLDEQEDSDCEHGPDDKYYWNCVDCGVRYPHGCGYGPKVYNPKLCNDCYAKGQ